MISPFWYIGDKTTFTGSRETRIGSSEVPQLFPNPEKPTESLAGYDQTAITLYKKKTGIPEPFNYSLPAEMGHFLENKALELFIRRFSGKESALSFIRMKTIYEMRKEAGEDVKAEDFQIGLYRHNTEYFIDGMIVHCDCVYIGDPTLAKKKKRLVTVHGIQVDLSKPFYIEAKSATKDATKRQPDSFVKGYDFDLLSWQGIPLKHFVQMQFQSSLMKIDVGYLALLHNTSEFQVWRVDKDKKKQGDIIDIVGKILKYISIGRMPKELAICQADIIELYPHLRNDFISLSGDAAKKIKEICGVYNKANRQIKNWESQKKDAQDALSVHLRDYDEIREGSTVLVKWQARNGGDSIGMDKKLMDGDSLLVWMKKNKMNVYRYLLRNDLIKQGKKSRSPAVKFKGD